MHLLPSVVLCGLIAGTAHAQTLSGTWCGVGEQTDPDGRKSYWTAHMRLTGPEGRMDYPSLACGGTLTFERTEGAVHFYRERIDYGRERCIDDGLVTVEPVGASIRWEWTGSGVTAISMLTPSCPAPPSTAAMNEKQRASS
jgi:hypothetical protein